ncbi:hypothetical protein FXN63_23020 [Pigmentiphaga aceris]|uniref:Uncharacterized protein n=1 Tax=Pigmentiphaga aceris TaxID=1940612 RepID=A0A5C0B273_9BURK|nr:hypothetical protein [Pigmentiphaga aceris]QEI08385.1 hypothetical protein FXN63_23020 [Pigmentiphaga aceris]
MLLTLQPSPVGKGQVDFFPGEGVSRNTLARLGDCLIARVKSATAGILVTEYRSASATSLVDLRLDRIDTSANIVRDASTTNAAQARPAVAGPQPEKLVLSGSVQGRGAVMAASNANDWLGNPEGQHALEGFAITWADQPSGVELIYTGRTRDLGQLPATRSGSYLGTRNQQQPIYSISFILAGPRADEYELSGQVAFSGQPPQALQPGLALAGPTGREPLIALRPRIVAKPSPHAARSPGLAAQSDRLATQPPAWSRQANT